MIISNLEIAVIPFDRKARFRVISPANIRLFNLGDVLEFELNGLDDEAIKMLLRAVTEPEPPKSDQGQAYWKGHFSTKEIAVAYAATASNLVILQGKEIPRTEVKRDPAGGWNVWIWKND